VADTHTHPLSNLGFGCDGTLLHPSGVVWGDPTICGDNNFEDLSGLVACDGVTHGGHLRVLSGDVFIPLVGPLDLTKGFFFGLERQGLAQHGPQGSPGLSADAVKEWEKDHGLSVAGAFEDWPKFDDCLHQQYHIRFIYRAYRLGNLRLMSALAVSNRLVSRFMLDPKDQDDADAIRRQIGAIKTMVANFPWMEVAFTPRDVRRIVGADKLAVVLGVEVDQLETLCDADHDPKTKPPDIWVPWLVDQLYNMGIRQVTPLHFADNQFGGFAVYDDLTNSGNQYATGKFAGVDPNPDMDFKLAFQQMQFTGALIPVDPNVLPTPRYDRSDANKGHCNTLKLQPAGIVLLDEMMKRGMMIDIAHLIDHTSVEKYQNRYTTAAKQLKNVELAISGPWPPYHFLPGKLRTVAS